MDNKSITYDLNTQLTFGKHKDKTIEQVIQDDPTYLYWMYDKGFTLSREVRRASNTRTKQRMYEARNKPREVHPANRVQQEHYGNVHVYGPGLTITTKGEIITNHEQGMRDLIGHLNSKHPEVFDNDEDIDF